MLSSSRERLIKLVRRSQTYISIFIFMTVFFVCWKFANLDIREIELSNWGKSGWIGRIWNSAVCLFAISIFVNSFLYLKNHTRIKYKKKCKITVFDKRNYCVEIEGTEIKIEDIDFF